MADNNLLGVEAATATAGFLGAVASLSAIRPLTRLQAMLAIFAGAVTASYITPLLMYYFSIDAPPVQNGTAFFLGLCSMHLVPGFLRLAEMFRNNPMSILRRILGAKDNPP